MIITREILRAWRACYSDEQIASVVPEEGLTPLQILDTDVPGEDKLWVVLRDAVISERDLRSLACKWAREALALIHDPDPRSVAAVDIGERYARGEATQEELDAARAAARDAAWDAPGDAAAAWAAVRAAARGAARGAAWDAAGDAQVEDCRAVLLRTETRPA